MFALRGRGTIQLRRAAVIDECHYRAAHAAMRREDFEFCLDLDRYPTWREYVSHLAALERGEGLGPGMVAASSFGAWVGGELVGRASVRHGLSPRLRRDGGHIGFCVLRQHRRHGYATQILRGSLDHLHGLGVDAALLVTTRTNIGSQRVIEACGGRVDETSSTPQLVHYWIG